jgi:hypothetical protein
MMSLGREPQEQGGLTLIKPPKGATDTQPVRLWLTAHPCPSPLRGSGFFDLLTRGLRPGLSIYRRSAAHIAPPDDV